MRVLAEGGEGERGLCCYCSYFVLELDVLALAFDLRGLALRLAVLLGFGHLCSRGGGGEVLQLGDLQYVEERLRRSSSRGRGLLFCLFFKCSEEE